VAVLCVFGMMEVVRRLQAWGVFMFMVLFIAFFVLPSALFLVGAAVLQSFHLLFGGLVMAAASIVFFVVSRGVEKQKKMKTQEERRRRDPSGVR
jgi:hypothetical protein